MKKEEIPMAEVRGSESAPSETVLSTSDSPEEITQGFKSLLFRKYSAGMQSSVR